MGAIWHWVGGRCPILAAALRYPSIQVAGGTHNIRYHQDVQVYLNIYFDIGFVLYHNCPMFIFSTIYLATSPAQAASTPLDKAPP